MLAAHKVKVGRVVSINTVLKSLGEPLLMLAFVLLFGLTKSLSAEAQVTVALPAAVPATMLAGRYKVYESEPASTLILTSFLIIGIVPFFQYLAGFLYDIIFVILTTYIISRYLHLLYVPFFWFGRCFNNTRHCGVMYSVVMLKRPQTIVQH